MLDRVEIALERRLAIGVRAAMADAGLARQKWPEEIHPGDDLPRTPSGKVRKAILRQRLRATAES